MFFHIMGYATGIALVDLASGDKGKLSFVSGLPAAST
jgi:hypothetical protein